MGAKHLEDVLKGIDPKPQSDGDPEAVLESLGPCAWAFPKPVFALDIEDGPKPVVTFGYVYLGVRSECRPDSFTVTFVGVETWRVTVKGRNLRPIYDRLQEHRVRRIRVVERDFAPDTDKQPVITKISVEEVPDE